MALHGNGGEVIKKLFMIVTTYTKIIAFKVESPLRLSIVYF